MIRPPVSDAAEERCACGQPLHYADDAVREQVQQFVDRLGPDVTIRVGDRAWRVPRHYIALHGIGAVALPSLGFPEVPA